MPTSASAKASGAIPRAPCRSSRSAARVPPPPDRARAAPRPSPGRPAFPRPARCPPGSASSDPARRTVVVQAAGEGAGRPEHQDRQHHADRDVGAGVGDEPADRAQRGERERDPDPTRWRPESAPGAPSSSSRRFRASPPPCVGTDDHEQDRSTGDAGGESRAELVRLEQICELRHVSVHRVPPRPVNANTDTRDREVIKVCLAATEREGQTAPVADARLGERGGAWEQRPKPPAAPMPRVRVRHG